VILLGNVKQIALEDSLFLNPYRVFANYILHGLYHNHEGSIDKGLIYRTYTTLIYFLHVNEPLLAVNMLRILSNHYAKAPRGQYTQLIILKQLQRIKNLS